MRRTNHTPLRRRVGPIGPYMKQWVTGPRGMFKATLTNVIDWCDYRPRSRKLINPVAKRVPEDWFNYFY
jgi:hypothetical protein